MTFNTGEQVMKGQFRRLNQPSEDIVNPMDFTQVHLQPLNRRGEVFDVAEAGRKKANGNPTFLMPGSATFSAPTFQLGLAKLI